MLTKAVIDFGDPLRIAAERFVRASFVPNYGARLTVFASHRLVIADARDKILHIAQFLQSHFHVVVIDPIDMLGSGLAYAQAV